MQLKWEEICILHQVECVCRLVQQKKEDRAQWSKIFSEWKYKYLTISKRREKHTQEKKKLKTVFGYISRDPLEKRVDYYREFISENTTSASANRSRVYFIGGIA